MSSRVTRITKQSQQPKAVVRDKQYYFNTLDIEHDLLKKATDLAERMMVAFMRENKVEVSLDPEDLANRIAEKLGKRGYYSSDHVGNTPLNKNADFNFDDGPVIIKTEKIEVKGRTVKEDKSEDSIADSMDALEGISI